MHAKSGRRSGVVALALSAVGLVVGIASTLVVAAIVAPATAGSYALAVKIVDAIIAGSTVASIVGLLAFGGLGAGAIAGIKWAIGFFGRKKAVA